MPRSLYLPQPHGLLHAVLLMAYGFLVQACLAQDYDALSQGVVKIVSTSPQGKIRVGTGFVVNLEEEIAYIVTAFHVVEGDKQPNLYFSGRRNVAVTGEVLNNDLSLDVSLLLVRGRNSLPRGTVAVALATDQSPKRGEQVATIGFPAGLGEWAVSTSTIGSQQGAKLTLSGAIAEGNSGSPVLRGNSVVAMITSVEGIAGHAIPALILDYTLRGWGVVPARSKEEDLALSVRQPELKAGQTFRDCPDCPEMVVVPAGSFQMGSPDGEKGRYPDEAPVHSVTIPAPFAVSKFEITREQFARFVRATGRGMSGGCWFWDDGDNKWKLDSARGWLAPGFPQSDDHPVVCVSFEDATAYAEWLAKQTGNAYRLLSEAEWEYAARAGTSTSRYWGDSEQQACDYANVPDWKANSKHPNWITFDCDDGYAETAPAGKYKANAFGLHDMLGNAKEWVQDCWNDNYNGAPTNSSAWLSGECGERVVRGGSWFSCSPGNARYAIRYGDIATVRNHDLGFRVARTLP